MCVLVILHGSVPNYPVVAAGNREEAYARQGEEPQLLDDTPRIWGGRDPKAGGTWLALNEYGLVIGTHQPSGTPVRSERGSITGVVGTGSRARHICC